MDERLLKQINRARANRTVVAVVTRLSDGWKELLTVDQFNEHVLADELAKRLRTGKSGIVELNGEDVFLEMHVPAPKLIVVGAVHISQALFPMAQACGFDVAVIDPRSAFATEERFGGVTLLADWPEEVLLDIPFDAFTAVVAVTHDPKIDDFPLKAALHADCFYVGALGSRKTHATRVERFKDAGLEDAVLERIHAPIGLDIGASSPAEIAVAILAEIIGALRKKEDT